jgi:cation transport regulator ChaC
LPTAEQTTIIAAAHGEFGSCREYLANTVTELAVLGIEEPGLTALLQEVDAIAARKTGHNAPGP